MGKHQLSALQQDFLRELVGRSSLPLSEIALQCGSRSEPLYKRFSQVHGYDALSMSNLRPKRLGLSRQQPLGLRDGRCAASQSAITAQ